MTPRLSQFRRYFLLLAALLVVACTSVTAPKTFNDQVGYGYAMVSAIYDSAAIATKAGKLSKADASNVLKQADSVRDALDIAKTLHAASDPAANDKLSAAISALGILQTYLAKAQP